MKGLLSMIRAICRSRHSAYRPYWLLSLLVLATSCDTVLQYPEEPGVDPTRPEARVTVSVKCDFAFKHISEIEYEVGHPSGLAYPGSRASSRIPSKHKMRFILRAFYSDDKSVAPVPVHSWAFTADPRTDVMETFDIGILPGDYRLVMWCDFVDAESGTDFYYSTDEFAEITLKEDEGHYGSNNYRNAFYGETALAVGSNARCPYHADIELVRPLAKYSFVSTDLAEFIESEAQHHTVRKGSIKTPDLADYTVRMVYTQYMPCAFNVHTGKPVDSRTNVEYHSLLSVLDQKQVLLSYDYIFTNGSETSIAVAMEVLHRDGSVVARVPQMDIPIKRHQHTIVSGKFLTTKSGGCIGINTKFDGEFNILIQ